MIDNTLSIRCLVRDDMPRVLHIEAESFDYPWDNDDFLNVLRQRNCIGMAADGPGGWKDVRGFMVYELHKPRLVILNFAVALEFRRQGVGRAMIERLIDKLSQQRRREIRMDIRERNVDAQLFLSEMGFKCWTILRGHYDHTDEDAYRYLLPSDAPAMEMLPESSA